MFNDLHPLLTYLHALCDRRRELIAHTREHPDDGYSSETVLVTALLIAGALSIVALIISRVRSKAESIDFG
jgi:hypothetical protein